ncbi:PLP-dependent transferase [Pterulicium gracile]|uniref:PLP-dependent transferase n=1 Tax=Pterulicium gracile TaxID=1884261 RepID=A0A5C3QVC7_9AGAR|nr:PLP-dependent transferase [Pterula gracilis]
MVQNPSPALQKWFSEDPPAFGRELREKLFYFDPEYIPLNHGSYGGTPKPVQEYFDEVDKRIEANTDLFMRIDLAPLLADVRERAANFLGIETDECYLVTNASLGLNTIMRNFVWNAEDVIVTTSVTYGSIQKTAEYIRDTPPNPKVSVMQLIFPTTHAEIIAKFRAHIECLVKARTSFAQNWGLRKKCNVKTAGKGKIVAIIDSIVSTPGMLMPWKEMVEICGEYGVWSVVDGAHSIGNEQGINLCEALPDFWVSNAHKWLTSKKSCAIMYVPQRNHHMFRTAIPTSSVYPSGSLKATYDWNGTIDWANYMAVNAALDMREWLGGEEKIWEYCHGLAVDGTRRLAEILGTQLLDKTENLEFTTMMCEVGLPISSSVPGTSEVDVAFKRKMLVERKAFISNYYHNGKFWARCSAQIYNDVGPYLPLPPPSILASLPLPGTSTDTEIRCRWKTLKKLDGSSSKFVRRLTRNSVARIRRERGRRRT